MSAEHVGNPRVLSLTDSMSFAPVLNAELFFPQIVGADT